jgi:hypothetical protein
MGQHSTLAELRDAVLAMLGESEISNSEWRFTDAAPYKTLDMLINNAEIALGHELLLKGCRTELVTRWDGLVYSADNEYLSWAQILWDTYEMTGTAPTTFRSPYFDAQKILRIIDATNSNCKFTIPMVHASQEEALNPSGPLNFNRYGLNAAAGTGPIAVLYQDTLKILPKVNQARTLDIEFVKSFGQIGKVIGATVTVGGSGYTTAPTVAVTGDGTGCTMEASVLGGSVSDLEAVWPTNPGQGYTTATLAFSGGGGTLAAATSVIGASVLPIEANMVHATWAAMLALVQKQRDTSGLRTLLYGDNRDIGDIQRLVQLLHNGRAGVIANNRPQYQGP